MGSVERAIADRAAESLAELAHLEVRPLFSGFGFHVDGVLVAAAWEGAFRLRHHEGSRWIYHEVDDALVDDPDRLVPLVRQRAAVLAQDPDARPRPRRSRGSRDSRPPSAE
ncbi:MAG TPA: hypothetical protein VKV06_00610 [Acidimicrobiales bacterium]|nr:hypothetical protein [Acidimicrobiales bacterium]